MKCTEFSFQTNDSFKVQVKMIKRTFNQKKKTLPHPLKKTHHNKYFAWG